MNELKKNLSEIPKVIHSKITGLIPECIVKYRIES